jgi:plasmid stabilization system protein ParE
MRKLSRTPGIVQVRQDLCDGQEHFFLGLLVPDRHRSDSKPLQIVRVLHAARGILKATSTQ